MTVLAPLHTSLDRVEVEVQNSSQLDDALNGAVENIKDAAIAQPVGILVTRTRPGIYTVQIHQAVPFGLIRQQHQPPGEGPDA